MADLRTRVDHAARGYREASAMYIGLGTILLILLIVFLVRALSRRA